MNAENSLLTFLLILYLRNRNPNLEFSLHTLNHKVFHGTLPNTGNRSRSVLAVAYRPAWAGPIQDVPQRNQEELSALPSSVHPFLGDPNTKEYEFSVGNKPDNMDFDAPGMNPSRWDL